jgi:hypothetical protein
MECKFFFQGDAEFFDFQGESSISKKAPRKDGK